MPYGMSRDRLWMDVRYATRTLRASPGFSAVALLMLALGIGANTAVFSVVSAVLLRPLPFPEPQRLVFLWESSTVGGPARFEVSPGDYVEWKRRNRAFSDIAGYATANYNLTGSGEPKRLSGIRTTGNLFNVLAMQAIVGRTLTPADDTAGAPPVAVLDERLWRSHFGGDPGLVGRHIQLDGLAYTVVGIVPADFRFPDQAASLWVPARFTATELAQRGNYFLYVVGRLKPGVSLTQAQADMTAVSAQLARDFPDSNTRAKAVVAAVHEHLTRSARPALALLFGAVTLVLLIAGANLAHLLLTRGTARRKELAVRQALGATSSRITRQLMTEHAVLAVGGGILGLLLAVPAFRYLGRLVPTGLPDVVKPTLDLRVLLFMTATTALMVVVFGAAPAIAASRSDLEAMLRSASGRGTARHHRFHGALVVAELTLTVILLTGCGLLIRSYLNVLSVDPGFATRHLLVIETPLTPSAYADAVRRSAFYGTVLKRVTALAGVTAAGFTSAPPLAMKGGSMFFSVEGEAQPAPEDFPRHIALDRVATPGYFRALGAPMVDGRDFDDRDAQLPISTAIINRTMANQRWPGQNPIGRRLKFGPPNVPGRTLTVVGVIADVHETGLDTPVAPAVYLPSNQGQDMPPFLWPQYLVVRTVGDPLAVAGAIQRAVWSVDRQQPVSNLRSMDAILDAELLNRSTQLTLVGAFAVLALVMASIGLYGVLSYAVGQRVRDIGVKMALGARRATIVAEVVRRAMILSALGIVLGLGTAAAVNRVLASWLFAVAPVDAATFAAAALLIGVITLAASSVPALRGATVDPAVVLRPD